MAHCLLTIIISYSFGQDARIGDFGRQELEGWHCLNPDFVTKRRHMLLIHLKMPEIINKYECIVYAVTGWILTGAEADEK